MDSDMRFEDVEGQAVPRLPFTSTNLPLIPDGEVMFDLSGAATHFGKSAELLRRLWTAAWGGFVSGDVPLVREPAADGPAATPSPAVESTRRAIIRRTKGAQLSDELFEEFMAICDARQLEPLCNQIYPTTRHNARTNLPELAIIVGIEGVRLIAHRTREHGGRDKTVYSCDPDGRLVGAETTVYRGFGDRRAAFTVPVFFEEYYPGEGKDELWDRMPRMNIGRVSEAASIRAAHPQETSRFYLPEEMTQSRVWRPASPAAARPARGHVTAPAPEGYSFDPSTAQI